MYRRVSLEAEAVALAPPTLCNRGAVAAVTDGRFPNCDATAARHSVPLRRYAAKAPIYMEGEASTGAMAVLDGCVALTKSLGDARRQIVDLIGPGDLFGFDGAELRGCAAEAVTGCRIRVIPLSKEERDRQAPRLLTHAARAISRQRDHAFLLGRKSAREKVASGLLRLDEVLNSDGSGFTCPLSRLDLADWLGLVIETVSRTLSQLQRDGLIAIHRQTRFEILDIAELRSAAALPALSQTRERPGRREGLAPP